MVESRKTQKVYAFCLRVGVQSCPGVARIERGGVVEGPSVRCTSRHPCLMEVSSGTSASRELSARLPDKGRQDDLAIEGASSARPATGAATHAQISHRPRRLKQTRRQARLRREIRRRRRPSRPTKRQPLPPGARFGTRLQDNREAKRLLGKSPTQP